MVKLQRYCLRFCFCVVLLVVCLTPFTVYADDLITDGTLVNLYVRNPNNLDGYVYSVGGTLDPGWEDTKYNQTFDLMSFSSNRNIVLDYELTLPFDIPSNSVANFAWHHVSNISGTFVRCSYPYDAPDKYYFRWLMADRIEVIIDDVVVAEFLPADTVVVQGYDYWKQMNFEDVPVDVDTDNVTFRFWFPLSGVVSGRGQTLDDVINLNPTYSTYSCSTYNHATSLAIAYHEVDPSLGLLEGIIEWLRGILQSITELPQKIWTHIEDGLKGLFVPDAQFMESYKAQWDAVLQDSMGGVYQSVSMIDDFYESFQVSSTQGTIHFPQVSVPVAGETFRFGGYEVEIVPSDAPFLQTVIDGIRLVMNAVCTLAVLQSFKRRYERVVSE